MTEAQLRPLSALPEEKRARAWSEAVKESAGKPVTRRDVERAASRFKAPPNLSRTEQQKKLLERHRTQRVCLTLSRDDYKAWENIAETDPVGVFLERILTATLIVLPSRLHLNALLEHSQELTQICDTSQDEDP
jgi:hypothetical protein